MAYSDSASATVTLPLIGVWLVDIIDIGALDPAYFPYGKAQRDHAIDVMGVGSFYAGRESPMFDYGEHIDVTYGFTIDVPNGSTYFSDLETLENYSKLKRSVWVRDNRGRAVYGNIYGFKVTDTAWGATVTFSVTQATRDVTLVTS